MRTLLLSLALLTSLSSPQKIVRPNKDITFYNGSLLYQGRTFDGIVVEYFENVGTTRETEYRAGLPDGIQREYLSYNGNLVAKREYRHGDNSGTHEGWFADGERRFHYEYNQKNQSHGDFWEWYASGHPSLFAHFENGELKGKKMWREDGKIYMNYVFSEGHAVGVPGTKLCYQVRDPKQTIK